MFITAVCVLFLIKLRWPKSKSIYDKAGYSDQIMLVTQIANRNFANDVIDPLQGCSQTFVIDKAKMGGKGEGGVWQHASQKMSKSRTSEALFSVFFIHFQIPRGMIYPTRRTDLCIAISRTSRTENLRGKCLVLQWSCPIFQHMSVPSQTTSVDMTRWKCETKQTW